MLFWDVAFLDSLTIHVVLTFLFIKFTLFLGGRILVLLVLRHKIVHIRLSFGELHLVHALTCVPMEECLAAEHCSEEFCHTLEHFLNCSGVPQESYCHLQALWWDIADSCLDVVRDPLNKVRAVLV